MRYIESYIHHNRIGVLLELYTPDDIAVRTREFKSLALDLAMQIAASNPAGVSDEAANEGDTESLMEQAWIKDPSMSVRDLLESVSKVLQAEIRIVRFVRYGDDNK